MDTEQSETCLYWALTVLVLYKMNDIENDGMSGIISAECLVSKISEGIYQYIQIYTCICGYMYMYVDLKVVMFIYAQFYWSSMFHSDEMVVF